MFKKCFNFIHQLQHHHKHHKVHIWNFYFTPEIFCNSKYYIQNINKKNLFKMENGNKNKMCKLTKPTIGTHDDIFHCDEVLACFMLQQLPKYANAKIVRSRNNDILNDCDIVVDVGGTFDKDKLRFDHHQKTFEHTLSSLRPEFGENYNHIRLSSAGLIYTYYGEEVIKEILKTKVLNLENKSDKDIEELTKIIYIQVYTNFIREIDAIDNGIPMCDQEPLYTISTGLSARVGEFNPQWNTSEDVDINEQFEKAKQLVGVEFIDKVSYYANTWWPARAIVEKAIKNRYNIHSSGEIFQLDKPCPWKQHFFEIEKNFNIEGVIKYGIFKNKNDDWRVVSVPINETSFLSRKALPEAWRGLRDEDLVEISGIEDIAFCHVNGFIGGCKTEQAALNMAIKSLL